MQQLNIKDAEAYTLARTIAKRRGTSLTDVVKTALRHEDERDLPQTRSPEERAARLARVQARMEPLDRARDAGEPVMSQQELDAWMYGEDGLPR